MRAGVTESALQQVLDDSTQKTTLNTEDVKVLNSIIDSYAMTNDQNDKIAKSKEEIKKIRKEIVNPVNGVDLKRSIEDLEKKESKLKSIVESKKNAIKKQYEKHGVEILKIESINQKIEMYNENILDIDKKLRQPENIGSMSLITESRKLAKLKNSAYREIEAMTLNKDESIAFVSISMISSFESEISECGIEAEKCSAEIKDLNNKIAEMENHIKPKVDEENRKIEEINLKKYEEIDRQVELEDRIFDKYGDVHNKDGSFAVLKEDVGKDENTVAAIKEIMKNNHEFSKLGNADMKQIANLLKSVSELNSLTSDIGYEALNAFLGPRKADEIPKVMQEAMKKHTIITNYKEKAINPRLNYLEKNAEIGLKSNKLNLFEKVYKKFINKQYKDNLISESYSDLIKNNIDSFNDILKGEHTTEEIEAKCKELVEAENKLKQKESEIAPDIVIAREEDEILKTTLGGLGVNTEKLIDKQNIAFSQIEINEFEAGEDKVEWMKEKDSEELEAGNIEKKGDDPLEYKVS